MGVAYTSGGDYVSSFLPKYGGSLYKEELCFKKLKLRLFLVGSEIFSLFLHIVSKSKYQKYKTPEISENKSVIIFKTLYSDSTHNFSV